MPSDCSAWPVMGLNLLYVFLHVDVQCMLRVLMASPMHLITQLGELIRKHLRHVHGSAMMVAAHCLLVLQPFAPQLLR